MKKQTNKRRPGFQMRCVCVWVRALAEETRSEAVSHVSSRGDGRQRLVTTRSCEFEGSK